MVATVGSINVLFNVQYGQAISGVNRLASTVEGSGNRMNRSVNKTNRSVLGLNRTMQNLRGREFRVLALSALRAQNSVDRLRSTLLATSALLGGFGAAFTLRGIQEYSDTYKTIGNRIRVVKQDAQSVAEVEEKIFRIAQKSRAQYEATGILFARIANSSKRLGISQEKVLRVTETIQKSFLVGGSTPIEAAQSAIQLSQGIASDRLQGDELRSVLENPALGQLLADQISGGDLGKLRELAKEGQLTAKTIVNAFAEASDEIDRLFESTEETIGQAFIKVDNALLKYIGTNDKVNASSRATVTVLNALAENMDTVASSIGILGAAALTVFGARTTNALFRQVGAMRDMRLEARDAAAANKELAASQVTMARGEFLRSRLALNAAMNQGTFTAKQLAREKKKVVAATVNLRNAQAAATAATQAHATALNQARVSAMGYAAAGNLARGAWSFIGGGFGAALLAAGTAMFFIQRNATEAAERSDRYAEAIERAGDKSQDASISIEAAAASLDLVAKAATAAEKLTNLATAQEDLAYFFGQMSELADQLGSAMSTASDEIVITDSSVSSLVQKFQEGSITAAELKDALDQIALANVDLAPIIKEIIDLTDEASASIGTINALRAALSDLGGAASVVPVVTEADVSLDAFGGYGEFKYGVRDTIDPPKGKKKRGGGGSKKTDAEKQADRFKETLKDLRLEAASFSLGDIDRKVLKTAESIGFAESEIQKFIDAASAGRMDEIPVKFQMIREEIQRIAELESIDQFTTDLAEAFGNFFSGVITGSQTFEEALKQLGQRLLQLITDLLIVQPLIEALKQSFSGIGGGGGIGGIFGGLVGALVKHDGGTVGAGGPGRILPASSLKASTPRLHSGTKPNELLTVMERGEEVLTKNQADRTSDTIAGLLSNIGERDSATNVYNIDARGADQAAIDRLERGLKQRDQAFGNNVARVNRNTNVRGVAT